MLINTVVSLPFLVRFVGREKPHTHTHSSLDAFAHLTMISILAAHNGCSVQFHIDLRTSNSSCSFIYHSYRAKDARVDT